jgi:predicted ATP-grasp superfamily ATP-dependent carboligase
MSGVILTSGKLWCSLVVIRCLGRHGIKVACGESRVDEIPLSTAFYSRYCKIHFSYPPFETEPENFVNAICDFANQHKEYDVLMPVYSETYVIAKYVDYIKSRSPHLKIPLHLYDYINIANDKLQITELAEKIRVPVPQTFYPHSIEEAKTIKDQINYPAVIKLRSAEAGLGMAYIRDSQEMPLIYEETVKKFSLDLNNLPIIQEMVPGIDYGAAALFNHGQLRAKVAFKSIRCVPPTGGRMVLRESVLQDQMLNALIALADEMHWHGLLMADFRLDERDNIPKLLEVNPRFWFSTYQAIAAGVEFPYLLYQMAAFNDIDPVENYKIGIRTGYIWNETLALFARLREPKNKIAAIKEYMKFNVKFEDMSFSDPLPTMTIAMSAVLRSLKIKRV